MNSAFTKVSNLKVNRASKIALTIASSTFFLYALGQAPIFKNIIAGAFSCSVGLLHKAAKLQTKLDENSKN